MATSAVSAARSQVEREWLRLNSFIMRDVNLRALKYHELYTFY